ncbi:LysR family transcriptional regulator [Candidimonas sp. SYP-B2681]|uniref:LysR family transcriptional regulator n=1 Tax=Candidimonas sp. SYP-B2681 TaxID=2497686 RepID=UPI000F8627C5|nr:LysR family transcriptional regulator [Candidimonas sp. SYP-B2681]RTZ47892.1 LysR family transcriptional regulator [Candidimonas sp. SYP-B2681]
MTRRIDPYSLRLFVATATEGSIARGAAREHIAASALSRRISDLEYALGVPLFVRSPRGIELTNAGQVVFERGLKIDDDIQQLKRDVQASDGVVNGTVRLWANMSSIIGYLPERLKNFTTTFPHVTLALSEVDTHEVIRACLDDKADVGVGVKTDVPAGLESWYFSSDPLLVVVPVGHALASERYVQFTQALAYPLIGVHPGGSLDTLLLQKAKEVLGTASIPVQVSSFDAACRMVEAGLGITIIPRSAARAYAGTRKFVRKPLVEVWAARELWIYSLRKSPRLRSVEALIEALQD